MQADAPASHMLPLLAIDRGGTFFQNLARFATQSEE